MAEYPSNTPDQPFKDRSSRLAVMGMIQLCFGAVFSFLCVAIVIVGGFLHIFMLVETLVVVTILGPPAALFITLGVGSIRARRWARALTLAAAWLYLVAGVDNVASLAFTPPQVVGAKLGMLPDRVGTWSAAMAVFDVVISGLFVWAYRGADVKATCAYYNPDPCWTDRRPLPIITLCLLYGIGILCTPVAGINGWAFSFFGVLLSGFQGAAAHMALAVVLICLLWGTWRLDPRAWLLSLVFASIYGLSWVISAATISPMEMYGAMDIPAESMEKHMATSWRLSQSFGATYYTLLAIGFVLYTKRFFTQEIEPIPV